MNMVMFSFVLLGFTLLMHLVFVNVIIGAAALTVVMRYVAYRRGGDAGAGVAGQEGIQDIGCLGLVRRGLGNDTHGVDGWTVPPQHDCHIHV